MAGSGLTKEEVESALLAAGMAQVSVQEAFSINDKDKDRQVLIGVARNSSSSADNGHT